MRVRGSNRLAIIIVLLVTIAALCVSAEGAWKDPDWGFRKQVTANHSRVVSSHQDFPILISIEDVDLKAKAQENAGDLFFTSDDGITKLAHEIESYNPLTGALVAWVKIPSISSAQDSMIYMYYGNADADSQEIPNDVWDSNYLAVHHMEEKEGNTLTDSTSNNNDGEILNNIILDAAGKINGADQYDGIDDRTVMPQVFDTEKQFTIEAWVNTQAKQGYIVSQRDTSSRGAFIQFTPNAFQMYVNSRLLSTYSAPGAWHYVVGTYDGTNARLYVDTRTPVSGTATLTWPNQSTFIGDRSNLGRAFRGTIDEIKISNKARSQEYIRTSYNNQNNPASFVIIGSEEFSHEIAIPIILNEYPSDGKTGINASSITELRFELYHPQGTLMNYTVTTSPNIGSSSGTEAGDGTYSLAVTGLEQDTTYTWTVEVADGTESASETFTFKTAKPELLPSTIIFSDPTPRNYTPSYVSNATYNPMLSLKIVDLANNPLSVVFETNASGTWQPIIGKQEEKDGVYRQRTTGMEVTNRRYYWRARVNDDYVSGIYSFVAKPFITKWIKQTNAATDAGPLAVDVNNDGIYEIFVTGTGKLVCYNGATGAEIWTYSDSSINIHSPAEIADLNNDGIPEIVIPALSKTIALHANNKSVYWAVPQPSGNKFLMILDTDGTKYPYVYIAYGDHYYGTAKIRKLRGTDGALMAEVPVWYPCYSGISAADANNDGKFEIYMCDRKEGYEGPEGLGKGMQAYDADDLSLLWYDGSLTCSSHLVVMADVNKDTILDSIALPQNDKNGGVYVIDGATGTKMTGKWATSLGLGTHTPFSVYDIDRDGNLEIATSRLGPVKIWDIGSWSLDTNLSNYNSSEPPRYADVIGDEKLELITTDTNGFMRIYDWQYQLLETWWLGSSVITTIVQDIDNDGQNELISVGTRGAVNVLDTGAYTPENKVRTNNQYYSEKRLGAGVYEPLPGAPQPIIKEVYPADEAIDVEFNPALAARIVDYHYDNMTIIISTNASGEWKIIDSKYDANVDSSRNNWYEFGTTGMDKGDTTYYWKVTASDPGADDKTTEQIFSFTTKQSTGGGGSSPMPGWDFRRKITIDDARVTGDQNDFPVLVDITDSHLMGNAQLSGNDILFTSSDGITRIAHEIESYNSGDGHLIAWTKVPALSSTQDTIIYMYYGNPTAEDQQDAEDVWDSSYLSVHHLEESEGTAIIDSTTNDNDGNALNGLTLDAVGKIDGADQYDGTDDRTVLPQVFDDEQQFTIEAWVNTEAKQGYIVSQRDTSSRGAFIQFYPNSFQMYVNNVFLSTASTVGTWHYVVGTYDGTNARLYINAGTPKSTTATLTWPNQSTFIGDRSTLGRAFRGKLDEIKISNIARSQTYITTSYNNQNNPTSFISVGAVEEVEEGGITTGTKPVISDVVPAHLSTDVQFTIDKISFSIYDGQDDLMDYSITTSPDIGSDSVTGVGNGRYSLDISALAPSTSYNVTIEVTDGSETARKTYKFRTIKGYAIDVTTSGSGTVVSSCNSPCAAGTTVEFTATPAAGWYLVGWAGGRLGKEITGKQLTKSIVLTDNLNVFASFRQIGSNLIADSTFDASINSEDLRNNSEGQDWWESRDNPLLNTTWGDRTLLTLNEDVIGGRSGKKAKLAESLVNNSYMTQEFVAPQTGSFSLEWDIYVDNIRDFNATDRAATQIIGRDSNNRNGPNAGSNDRFVMLGFYKRDGTTINRDTISLIAQNKDSTTSNSSTWTTIATNLRSDTWYNIRVDMDVVSRRYNVTVRNNETNVAARNLEALNPLLSKLTHISFASWNDARGTFYVDNVKEAI